MTCPCMLMCQRELLIIHMLRYLRLVCRKVFLWVAILILHAEDESYCIVISPLRKLPSLDSRCYAHKRTAIGI